MRRSSVGKSFTTSPGAAASAPRGARLVLSPPASNAPLPHFRAHHDVLAPQIDAKRLQPAWRVHSRLAGLFEANLITTEECDAAAVWGRWAERTDRSITSKWELRVDGGGTPCGEPTVRRLNAAGALRRCAEALGQDRVVLLQACIIMDTPWQHLARRLGMSRDAARLRVVEAIVALTRWRRGEPVRPPATASRPLPDPNRQRH